MSVAANRYAKALIDALSADKAETGLEQLRRLESIFQGQPQARRLFENPTVSSDKRKAMIEEIGVAAGFSREIRNFTGILIDRNRLDLLAEIITAYEKLFDERMGIVRATVTTAQPLDDRQRAELSVKLQKLTGKQVRMSIEVDPALIGGAVARVGSTIYDGSLRQQLESFKAKLGNE